MKTKGPEPKGGAAVMQRTRTWIILYALGIAILILSLCQSEPEKPPQPPASVSHRAAAPLPGMPSESMRP